ncbi:unnamed protein product, partial [Phaeothamnion confervicola]
ERSLTCLHHNYTTLVAILQNLTVAALAPPGQTVAALEALGDRSRRVIDHLVHRTPIASTGIYKSRIAEVWADHRGITA